MDVFVVSWTGNNKTENYYEVFSDIDNAKLLINNLKNIRKHLFDSTFGSFTFLGRNVYYDFKKNDLDAYLEIKTLFD
jgi:hypothetical protein